MGAVRMGEGGRVGGGGGITGGRHRTFVVTPAALPTLVESVIGLAGAGREVAWCDW